MSKHFSKAGQEPGVEEPEPAETFTSIEEDIGNLVEAIPGDDEALEMIRADPSNKRPQPKKLCMDFSKKTWKLKTLDHLENVHPDILVELDLAKNQLKSLLFTPDTGLNKFKKLAVISAPNNDIASVTLQLPALLYLDLSNNQLLEIPDLSPVKLLEYLNLSNNNIRHSSWERLRDIPKVQEVYLAHNKLEWKADEFCLSAVDVLGPLKKLTKLDLLHNDFIKLFEENEPSPLSHRPWLIDKVKSLKELDGEEITSHERKNAASEKDVPQDKTLGLEMEETEGERDIRERKEKDEAEKAENSRQAARALPGEGGPLLTEMNDLLQKCFTDPSGTISNVNMLLDRVEKCVARKASDRRVFESDEAADMLKESFMQNSLLLMERQPHVQKHLLRVLAELGVVSECGLGPRCLDQLQDLMSASDDYQDDVVDTIQEVIVPKLQDEDTDEDVRDVLLSCLLKLSGNDAIAETLQSLVSNMVRWLEKNPENHAVVGVLVAATGNRKNIRVLEKQELPKKVSLALPEARSSADMVRYLHLLKIVQNMARDDAKSAATFKKFKVHTDLIKETLQLLGPKKGLNDNMIEKLVATMSTVDALMTHEPSVAQEAVKRKYHEQLASIHLLDGIHPLLISACFNGVLSILQADLPDDEILTNQMELTHTLQGVVPLLQYLGGKKYDDMCVTAKAVQDNRQPLELSMQTHPHVLKAIEAATNVIAHYCCKAVDQSYPGYADAAEVSARLNNNERETRLFELLNVPNDEVKLASVFCLQQVPLTEIEADELGRLVSIVTECENITAGRTEEVLGGVLDILKRMALEESTNGWEFRYTYASDVVPGVLQVLVQNTVRDAQGNKQETKEKHALSEGCKEFLKAATTWDEAKMMMRETKAMDFFQEVMEAQQKYVETDIPCFVERCGIGMHQLTLLQALGKLSLCPKNFRGEIIKGQVGIRTAYRIAEVLSGQCDITPETIKRDDASGSMDTAITAAQEGLVFVKRDTSKEWEQLTRERIAQHHHFKMANGLDTVFNFLLDPANERAPHVRDAFMPRGLVEAATAMANQAEQTGAQLEVDNAKKEAGEIQLYDASADASSKIAGRQLLLQAFQEEIDADGIGGPAVGSGLITEAAEVLLPGRPSQGDASKARTRQEEQNSATNAALTVCINLLWYGDDETVNDTLDRLCKLNKLRPLCQLCAESDWTTLNLGTKLLLIIDEMLSLPPEELNEDPSALPIYDIASQLIHWILKSMSGHLTKTRTFEKKQENIIRITAVLAHKLAGQLHFVTFNDNQRLKVLLNEKGVFTDDAMGRIQEAVQAETTAFLFNKLFDKEVMKIFIDILFWDVGHNSNVGSIESSIDCDRRDDIRFNIMGFIAETLRTNVDMRYQVLEMFNRCEITESTSLRASWMQQMLQTVQEKLYMSALQEYMYEMYPVEEERILDCQWFDSPNDKVWPYAQFRQLLVLTSHAFYFLSEPLMLTDPCSVCPPENFCPQGPTLIARYEYEKLVKIVRGFGGMRLRLFFIVTNPVTMERTQEFETFGSLHYGVVNRIVKQFKIVCGDSNRPGVKEDILVDLKIIEEELTKDGIKDKCDNADIASLRYIACLEDTGKGAPKARQIVISNNTVYALREEMRHFMKDNNTLEEAGLADDAFLKLLWKMDLADIEEVKFGLTQECTVEFCKGGDAEHTLIFGGDYTREHFKRSFQQAQPDLDSWQSKVVDASELIQ